MTFERRAASCPRTVEKSSDGTPKSRACLTNEAGRDGEKTKNPRAASCAAQGFSCPEQKKLHYRYLNSFIREFSEGMFSYSRPLPL